MALKNLARCGAMSLLQIACAGNIDGELLALSRKFAESPAAACGEIASEARHLASSQTNAVDRLLCENLAAAAQFAFAEHELDEALLADTMQLCASNYAASVESNAPFCEALAAHNKIVCLTDVHDFAAAYDASTNALARIAGVPTTDDEERLWRYATLHGAGFRLGIADAFKTYAAFSLLRKDRLADVSLYTNGLPEVVIIGIERMRGDN